MVQRLYSKLLLSSRTRVAGVLLLPSSYLQVSDSTGLGRGSSRGSRPSLGSLWSGATAQINNILYFYYLSRYLSIFIKQRVNNIEAFSASAVNHTQSPPFAFFMPFCTPFTGNTLAASPICSAA